MHPANTKDSLKLAETCINFRLGQMRQKLGRLLQSWGEFLTLYSQRRFRISSVDVTQLKEAPFLKHPGILLYIIEFNFFKYITDDCTGEEEILSGVESPGNYWYFAHKIFSGYW